MTAAIRAVLFDFGNVLGRFDHLKACTTLANLTGGSLTGEEVRASLFADNGLATHFERGAIDARSFMRSVCAELGIMPFDDMTDFTRVWGDIFTDAGMEPILKRLKSFVEIGILSNTDPIHWSYIERMPVVRYVDLTKNVILSFEVGTRKPDPRIYLEAANQLGFEPREIVYIDDLGANVKAARELGFHAECFNATKQSVESLADILATYGLMELTPA